MKRKCRGHLLETQSRDPSFPPAQAAARPWLRSLPWAPFFWRLYPMNSFCHWLNAAARREPLINFPSCLRLYLLQRKQGNPYKLNRSKLTACAGASLERIIAPWLRGTEEKNEHRNRWQRFWLALQCPAGSPSTGHVCDRVSINQVFWQRVEGKPFRVLNQHPLPGTPCLISLSPLGSVLLCLACPFALGDALSVRDSHLLCILLLMILIIFNVFMFA